MTFADIDFSEYEDDIEVSDRLPYCQLTNPPKGNDGELNDHIKKQGVTWGFFITKLSAEEAGFTPDAHWKPHTQHFASKSEEGFLSSDFRVLVLSRSQIEVYENIPANDGSDKAFRVYRGLGYEGSNTPTHWMDLAMGTATGTKEKLANDMPRYQALTRYLLLFVSADNTPLHTKPFIYTGKGASSVGFGREYTKHCYDISDAFFAAQPGGNSNQRLAKKALAFTVFAASFSYGRNKEGHSPFSFPAIRSYAGTEEKKIGRDRGRFVTLRPAPLNSLLISKKSPTGAAVIQFLTDYADFDKPPAIETAQQPVYDNYGSQPSYTHPALGQPAATYGGYPPAPIAPPPAPAPVRDRFTEFVEKVTHSGLNRDGWKALKPDNYPAPFGSYFPTLELVYEHGEKTPGFLEWFETFVVDAFRAPAPIPPALPIGAQPGWDNADDGDMPF